MAFSTGPLELRVGDAVAAEREYRTGVELAQELGQRGQVTNLAAGLVDALIAQDRLEEAGQYAALAQASAQEGDAGGQAFSRMASARLLVRRGHADDAVLLAREAVALMADTSELYNFAGMLLSEADVLRLAGRYAEATAAVRRAIDIAERKGAVAEADRAREQLATNGTT